MPEWKASVLAAEAETDAVQRGKGGGRKGSWGIGPLLPGGGANLRTLAMLGGGV